MTEKENGSVVRNKASSRPAGKYSGVLKNCYRLFIVFAILLILSISLTSVLIIQQNKQSIQQIASENVIQNTCNMLDLSLSEVHATLVQATKNGSIIDYVINPDSSRYSVRSMAMVALASTAAENALIEEIYLYIPANKTVLNSNYELFAADQFLSAPLQETDYQYSHPMIYAGRKAILLVLDGHLFLSMDFPLTDSLRLGKLICRINENALLSQINDPVNGYLYFFSQGKTPLFPDRIQYPESILSLASRDLIPRMGARTVSGYSGVIILFFPGNIGFLGEMLNRTILFEILGLVVFVAVLCILFGKKMIQWLIRPLADVVESISRASKVYAPEENHNEFALISSTIQTATTRADNMDKVIQSFLPEISYNFYQELLEGRWISAAQMQDTLENISSPLRYGNRFAVMIVDYTGLESITKLLVPVVQEKISHYSHLYTFRYHIHIEKNSRNVVFLCFDNSSTTPELLQMLYHLKKDLFTIHVKLRIGYGDVCTSLSDICLSYQSALSYLNKSSAEEKNEAAEIKSVALDDHFIQSELDRFLAGSIDMPDVDKLEFLQQMNAQLFSHCTSPQDRLSVWNLLCRDLLIQGEKYALKAETQAAITAHAPTEEMLASNEGIEQQGRLLCVSILNQIDVQRSKKQYQHIVTIQKYIDEQYANPDLGLQNIADSVGLSPQYVSKLFKDMKAVNINEYVNSVRIGHACRLLSTTQLSVKEISSMIGFNSPQHFSRTFSRIHQITPLQYRALHQKDPG